jgi:hypothetical protein
MIYEIINKETAADSGMAGSPGRSAAHYGQPAGRRRALPAVPTLAVLARRGGLRWRPGGLAHAHRTVARSHPRAPRRVSPAARLGLLSDPQPVGRRLGPLPGQPGLPGTGHHQLRRRLGRRHTGRWHAARAGAGASAPDGRRHRAADQCRFREGLCRRPRRRGAPRARGRGHRHRGRLDRGLDRQRPPRRSSSWPSPSSACAPPAPPSTPAARTRC